MGTAIKHPMPDRVKPSFVIFDIWALWRSGLSVRVSICQNLIALIRNSIQKTAKLNSADWWMLPVQSPRLTGHCPSSSLVSSTQQASTYQYRYQLYKCQYKYQCWVNSQQ